MSRVDVLTVASVKRSKREATMIVKMEKVTDSALAKLVTFIHSDENIAESTAGRTMVVEIKSVNGAGKGRSATGGQAFLYAIDLEVMDSYTSVDGRGTERTDPKYLLRAYEILVGN